ncbi:MAG: hypothetical protein ACT4QD_19120 [Acidobacteriota bacterium]
MTIYEATPSAEPPFATSNLSIGTFGFLCGALFALARGVGAVRDRLRS